VKIISIKVRDVEKWNLFSLCDPYKRILNKDSLTIKKLIYSSSKIPWLRKISIKFERSDFWTLSVHLSLQHRLHWIHKLKVTGPVWLHFWITSIQYTIVSLFPCQFIFLHLLCTKNCNKCHKTSIQTSSRVLPI